MKRSRTYGHYLGNNKRPRQTSWSRRNKNNPSIVTELTESDDSLIDDSHPAFFVETSSVIGDESVNPQSLEWDVSSISSCNSVPEIYISPSESSSSSDSNIGESSECDAELKLADNVPIFSRSILSQSDSCRLVLAFKHKYNLSREGIEDLLQLLKLHLPIRIPFPKSATVLQKSVLAEPIFMDFCFYCRRCETNLTDAFYCSVCKTIYSEPELRGKGHFFIVLKLRPQFEVLLRDPRLNGALSLSLRRRQNCPNLPDMVQDLRLGPNDIYCSFNTDGVPVFKSSKYSIWPVLLSLCDLPYVYRKNNVLLAALWCGADKINPHLVFSKIVPEWNSLAREPLVWRDNDGVRMSSKIFFVSCCVDSAARYVLQGIGQYNGKFGCSWCTHPGIRVKKGKGSVRVYPSSTTAELRTNEQFRNSILIGDRNSGVKCATPLLLLEKFNIVDGFVVDPMHGVFLGVVKQLISLWMPASTDYSLSKWMNTVNLRILSTKVPTEISRVTRDLQQLPYMKAKEYRTLLFILPAILKGILPVRHHRNLCRLSNVMYLLSCDGSSSVDFLYVQSQLKQFDHEIPNLYGEEHVSFNIHILLHLVQVYRNWGPLHNSSAFSFESFNGKILKFIKSANGAPVQLCMKYFEDLHLRSSCGTEFLNTRDVYQFFGKMIKARSSSHANREFKGPFKLVVPDIHVIEAVQKVIDLSPNAILKSYKTAYIESALFKSKETKRRADCYIMAGENLLGRILYFLQVSQDGQEFKFAVVEKFCVSKLRYTVYGYSCSNSPDTSVDIIKLEDIKARKFFKIVFDDQMYFLSVCNLLEAD